MKIPLQDYFEDLKQEVLRMAEIKSITPADCYRLSLKIQNKTQKRISETTLKRVFGFAAASYKSSTFTCNALAEYCDYPSYTAFLTKKEKEGLDTIETKSWSEILETAHKISRFSLESNKHRSGIPYNYTVYRSQLHQIIEEFTEGNSTSCIIKAPAGGGKTIGLTKWVERHINQKSIKRNIYLFINTSNLLSSSIFSFHGVHWLGYLLGLKKGEQLYKFINSYTDSAPGNFYLIIDNMTNSQLDSKQYHAIFAQLIEMSNYFSALPWFKIIVSLRPSIWEKHKHLIEQNNTISKQWFTTANQFNGFSLPEIQKITCSITNRKLEETKSVNDQLPFIQLPIYFQIYYQLKGKHFYPECITDSDHFRILGIHVTKYVLKGMYYNEKRMLLDKLSRYAIYKDNSLCVEQFKATSIYRQSPEAYRELVNSGIVHIHRNTIGSREISEIRFQSITIGAYFLAQRFLQKNRNNFDQNLVHFINKTHYPNPVKIETLKWLILFALESSNFQLLNHLRTANFIVNKELGIIQFINNCLSTTLDNVRLQAFNEALPTLQYLDFALIHISIISKNKPLLESFLTYDLNTHHQILVHSALSLIALASLNDEDMEYHLRKLSKIKAKAFTSFPLNPYTQLKALFNFFKKGIVDTQALREITAFNFRHYRDNNQISHPLIFSLAFLVSNLSDSLRKPIRLLYAIRKYETINKLPYTEEYINFIQIMKAYGWIENKHIQKAEAIQYAAPTSLADKPSIQILHAIYLTKLALAKRKNSLPFVEKAIMIAQKNSFLFSEAYIRLFHIEVLSLICSSSELIDEHQAKLKTVFKNTGFHIESFNKWVKKDLASLYTLDLN